MLALIVKDSAIPPHAWLEFGAASPLSSRPVRVLARPSATPSVLLALSGTTTRQRFGWLAARERKPRDRPAVVLSDHRRCPHARGLSANDAAELEPERERPGSGPGPRHRAGAAPPVAVRGPPQYSTSPRRAEYFQQPRGSAQEPVVSVAAPAVMLWAQRQLPLAMARRLVAPSTTKARCVPCRTVSGSQLPW